MNRSNLVVLKFLYVRLYSRTACATINHVNFVPYSPRSIRKNASYFLETSTSTSKTFFSTRTSQTSTETVRPKITRKSKASAINNDNDRLEEFNEEKIKSTVEEYQRKVSSNDHNSQLKSQEDEEFDLADQFGTLTMGETGVPVTDEHSKSTKKEIDKLKSEIYSIDAADEEDDTTVIPLDYRERWNMRKLRIRVKEEIRNGQLPKALDMFTHAIKAGGFNYDLSDLGQLYTILIAECGRPGHVKMAFRLFSDMKKRGCKVKPGVYTSLFNAIAMSVGDKEKNLERLERTRIEMAEKGYIANLFHYHVMIKAYGRLGEIQKAFALVDEMIEQSLNPETIKLRPTTETFNFLLQACISEKENGFRHGLRTWTKMLEMRIKPDIYTFNLFLRTVRECGIVIPKSLRKELGRIVADRTTMLDIPAQKEDQQLIVSTNQLSEIDNQEMKLLPPIMQEGGLGGNCLSVLSGLQSTELTQNQEYSRNPLSSVGVSMEEAGSEIQTLLINSKTPGRTVQKLLMYEENRLALLGGLKSIICELDNFRVYPDLKTVTELVQLSNPLDISDVLHYMEKKRIKPDTDFFNMVIKKYIKWNKVREARSTLQLMHKKRTHPNVATWGIFTISCRSWKEGKGLLKSMDNFNMEPNIEIMGGLLAASVSSCDPRYVLRVMEEVKVRGLKPDALFVKNVLDFRDKARKGVINWETGLDVQPNSLRKQLEENEEFFEYLQKFKLRYHAWINNIPESIINEVNHPEIINDPWTEDYVNRIKSLKAKVEY